MSRRVTIDTVAKSCGVSKMAVSFALRGSAQISVALRERILKKTDELGYVPSRAARSLNGQAAPRIGIVLPMAGSPVHARNLQAFDRICRDRGIETDVHFHYWHVETERKILESLFDDGVSGLILSPAGPETSGSLLRLQNAGLSAPFVTFGSLHGSHSALEKHLGNYAPDSRNMSEVCLGHLYDFGHRNVAVLFQGPQTPRGGASQLSNSFLAAARRFSGLRLELFYLDDSSSPIRKKILRGEPCELEDLIETDDQLAGYFLDHPFEATVAVTSDDLSALSLLNECHRRKIDVPNSLSIFSLGGSSICRMSSLPLAHAAMPIKEVASHVVEKLLAGADAKKEEYTYRFTMVDAATLANRTDFPSLPKAKREAISAVVSQKRSNQPKTKHENIS